MAAPKKLKILFVTSEVLPFVKTGGLADVSQALPQTLMELGHEIRIVVPKYGSIDERKYKIHEIVRLKDLHTQIGEKDVVYSLRSCFLTGPKTKVQIYFLDNHEYFGSRKSLYVDPDTNSDYPDNDERFILFSRAVFELIKELGWIPDIIHCNEWQCGLIPAYMKTLYKDNPYLKNVKTLFTIHNLAYQGFFPKDIFYKTGLPAELNSEAGIEIYGRLNFMKSGLVYSDAINTVSETYSHEICQNEVLGAGLDKILTSRKNDLYGILNGIDDKVWNPELDPLIAKNYSDKKLSLKCVNKKSLCEKFNLSYDDNVPVIGIISRLVDGKGFDLITDALDEIMSYNLKFILLGNGDKKYHSIFEQMQKKYPEKFACLLGYDEELAHLIEAGADIFLMPSRYEPCGLNQMYSQVYGTIPVVSYTGGLADTVEKYDEQQRKGTGFVMQKYAKENLLDEIKKALSYYSDKDVWNNIVVSAMNKDFSWTTSAKKYVDLYRRMIQGGED
jgi:starch synthase